MTAYVARLEMQSPLKILLNVARLPKNAVRAFVDLCTRVLFIEDERNRRAAVAASAWEDATAKRLKNVKTAIDIAQSAKQRDPIWVPHMDQLVEGVIKLENVDLRLKRIEGPREE